MKSAVEKLPITDKEVKKLTGLRDVHRLIPQESLPQLSRRDPTAYFPMSTDVVIRPSLLQRLREDTAWRQTFLTTIAANRHRQKSRLFGGLSTVILMPLLLTILPRLLWVDELVLVGIALVGTPLLYALLHWVANAILFKPAEEPVQTTIAASLTTLKPTPLGTLLDEVERYNRTVHELATYLGAVEQLANAGNPVRIHNKDETIQAFQQMRADLVRALKTERIFRETPQLNPEQFSIDFLPLKALEFTEQAKDCERLVNEAIEIGARVQEEMKKLSPLDARQTPDDAEGA